MKENEAIKHLELCKQSRIFIPNNSVLDMAIQALEKQIPKKPLHNGANWYKCHNGCEVHKKTFEKDWYCPKCGQKLDWSE